MSKSKKQQAQEKSERKTFIVMGVIILVILVAFWSM